jgi:hypothetical protein
MACYGNSFTSLYVNEVPFRRKHTYGPPRPVTGIALLFLYVDHVCTSQETPMGLHGLLPG